MAYDFNADDIFEMAEQLEKNGAAFYRQAASAVQDADAQKLLLELAAMEDDHLATFSQMRAQLTNAEKTSNLFDPDNESTAYLRSLADIRVFFEKQMDMSSMEEILKAAIGAEKDSIVFYLGMKDLVPEKLGKNKLEDIIKEEMGHIRLLSRHLVALRK